MSKLGSGSSGKSGFGWRKAKSGDKKIGFGRAGAEKKELGKTQFKTTSKDPKTQFKKKKAAVNSFFTKKNNQKNRTHLKSDEKRKPRTQFGTAKDTPDEENETQESKSKFQAENYTETYLKNKQAKLAAKGEGISDEKAFATKIREEQKEKQMRGRANQLHEHIYMWKRKIETGECDKQMGEANILVLRAEYYSIDPRYRPY